MPIEKKNIPNSQSSKTLFPNPFHFINTAAVPFLNCQKMQFFKGTQKQNLYHKEITRHFHSGISNHASYGH